ncbi:MAG: NAAT family transporter, partial [Lentisphaeria bacterium]|nr:NAAT family transporter [Lentisphaeria bacterium]
MPVEAVVGVFVKFLVLLTPFFILSVFVSVTDGLLEKERKKLAKRTTIAIWIVSLVIYFFGNRLFAYMGLTIPAFQAGTGILLMLSGIGLVRGNNSADVPRNPDDIAVVPLAIPYTVGPGTLGALLVMSAEAVSWKARVIDIAGISVAVAVIGVLLFFSEGLLKLLKRKGLDILSKLTGLFLSALAAQLILNGL